MSRQKKTLEIIQSKKSHFTDQQTETWRGKVVSHS